MKVKLCSFVIGKTYTTAEEMPESITANSAMFSCHQFPFSALTLLAGRQEGCLFVGGDDLEHCTSYSSSCHHHFHHP